MRLRLARAPTLEVHDRGQRPRRSRHLYRQLRLRPQSRRHLYAIEAPPANCNGNSRPPGRAATMLLASTDSPLRSSPSPTYGTSSSLRPSLTATPCTSAAAITTSTPSMPAPATPLEVPRWRRRPLLARHRRWNPLYRRLGRRPLRAQCPHRHAPLEVRDRHRPSPSCRASPARPLSPPASSSSAAATTSSTPAMPIPASNSRRQSNHNSWIVASRPPSRIGIVYITTSDTMRFRALDLKTGAPL